MNIFMNGLKNATNYTLTENGGIAHKSTNSKLYDMFALGGAFRSRSDADVITLFKDAYAENPVYALKCLFYLGDCRGGAGERRFFRLCYRWLAQNDIEAARRNLEHIPLYRRWDDLYCLEGTKLESEMFQFMKKQLVLDMQSKTPSLLAKWLKSCNTSSAESRRLGEKTRIAFGMTQRQYRKTLSVLRERINVLERLMSAGKWDEIEFDKIPSRAGMIYKNAFARHDIERAKSEKEVQTYEQFAKSDAKVNAKILNPVDIANKVFTTNNPTETDRLMLDKYWSNLKDYYNGREENGIAVCDVSGSMTGEPLNAALSMGAYIAERGKGPFANHFITFSNKPELIEFTGMDIYDKLRRARGANWAMNTNIEATLDLLLKTAIANKCSKEEMPTRLYIFSDMEFDRCVTTGLSNTFYGYNENYLNLSKVNTLFEATKEKWNQFGYELPDVIFWNLAARNNNIPAIGKGFSCVSGFSMNMIECILSGKDGIDLMYEKLDSDRYFNIK